MPSLPIIVNDVSEFNAYDALLRLLDELGVSATGSESTEGHSGFPVSVTLKGGQTLTFDVPLPAAFSHLDPDNIGVAVLDALGKVRQTWGLARRLPIFRSSQSVLESPIGPLFEEGFRGTHGALYFDGYRYFAGGVAGTRTPEVFVLVVNAQEEKLAKRQASKSERMAHALKRLGKALTMNQTRQDLAVSACHVIASTAELAAVLLWTLDGDRDILELTTSVGANRQASGLLSTLKMRGGSSCVAELVADSREPFHAADVAANLITANLEAKFCYLKPGGVSVHPLVIQDRLIGVLELVARDGDVYFEENLELFATIAEHLALAINSAMLFENLEKWATHDALTGLPNHRRLHEFLHQRMAEGDRSDQEVGVIMIDVDHFRAFNEEEGHDAGDDVLRIVAEGIQSCLRPYDLAGRYGGEEFTVVMPGSGLAATATVAERIRERIATTHYRTKSGQERSVTVSLGCAAYPVTAADAATVLKAADTALYEAKRGGRNRVCVYEGRYRAPSEVRDVRLQRVFALMPKKERAAAENMLARLRPHMTKMAESLGVSKAQHEILTALVAIGPTYLRLAKRGPKRQLDAFERDDALRALLPHLHGLAHAAGAANVTKPPRMSLLGRMLTCAMAWEGEVPESAADANLLAVIDASREAA